MSRFLLAAVTAIVLGMMGAAIGCGTQGDSAGGGAGSSDKMSKMEGGAMDSGAMDSGAMDSGKMDGGAMDSEKMEAGKMDAGKMATP